VNPAGVLCVLDTMLLTSTLASFWMWFQPVPAAPAVPAPVIAAPSVVVRVAAAPTAAEVIKSVQAFYANIKQVTAMFRQEVTSTTFGDAKTSDGKVWISKPGKMRWDYYSKAKKNKVKIKKSFISNGDFLYVVEYDNKQVIKKNLSNDLMPVAVSFLYGKGDLATDFTGEIDKSGKYGGKDDLVLGLMPKTPSAQYKKLFLVVDPGNFRVKQSIIVDSADNVNHFRFFTPDFDKAVEAKWFEFDPKEVPSFRIVDADAQAATAAPGAGSAAPAAKTTTPAPAPAKTK
jgi:outer membrane lipoprotein carrier protein